MLITQKLPSFEGVVAGQTAICKCPIGRTYHDISLVYTGASLAQMTEIRILVNGKVIQRMSATDRDGLNQFMGRAAAGGILVIPFNRYGMLNREAEEETALNTGFDANSTVNVAQLNIEVDIDAGAPATTLTAYARQSEGKAGGPGVLIFTQVFPRPIAGAGLVEIADLPKGGSESQLINCIMFKTAAITNIVVNRANSDLFDRTIALNDRYHTDGVRTPVAGYEFVDTTEDGYGGSPLDLRGYSDFRLKLTASGADAAHKVYVEYIGALTA